MHLLLSQNGVNRMRFGGMIQLVYTLLYIVVFITVCTISYPTSNCREYASKAMMIEKWDKKIPR